MIFERVEDGAEERLRKVLISDKQFSPDRIEKVLRSDMYMLFSNYCVMSPENLQVAIEVQKDGTYKFMVEVKSNRLKIFGSLPE